MSNGNGGGVQIAPQGQEIAPQLNIFTQYVKDLSFENPHAPRSLAPSGTQPAINIQVNVSANPMQDGNVEVLLKIEGKAETPGMVLFSFELTYAGLFRIQNVPQDSLRPVMLIECPRLLFPFAREIIAGAVTNGGFPPLLLDPIDFVSLYRQGTAQTASPPVGQA